MHPGICWMNNDDRAYANFHNHFQHLYNEDMPVKTKKN